MKKVLKAQFISLVAMLSLLLFSAMPVAHAAGSATISLSPATGSYKSGDSFDITVTENSGTDPTNAVDISLSISGADATKIQFTGSNGSGTSFTSFSATYTATTARLVSYVNPGTPGSLTGSQKVGTVSVQVKTISAATTAKVTVSGNSAVASAVSNTNVWDQVADSSALTLNPVTSNPTTPTTTPKTTTPKKTTTTTITPSPEVQKANPTTPVPANINSNAITGYYVSILVKDTKNKPVSGAKVTLGNHSSTTDDNGISGFVNIAPGTYKIKVTKGSVEGSSTINVDGSQPQATAQQFVVTVKPKYNLALIGGVAAGLLILFIILMIIKNSGGKFKTTHYKGNDIPQVVVGGSNQPPAAPVPPVNTGTPTVKPASGPMPPANATSPSATVKTPVDNSNMVKPTIITPSSKV